MGLIKYYLSVSLTILSPYLGKHFKEVVDIQCYHGITPTAAGINIIAPYVPLYHHLEDMETNIANDVNATPTDQNDFQALRYFCSQGYHHENFRDVRELIAEGVILYDQTWALFRSGDLVVSRDPVGGYEITEVTSVKLEHRPPGFAGFSEDRPFELGQVWIIYSQQLTWEAGDFRKVSKQHCLKKFPDSKKIEELEVYPLSHYKEKEKLREDLLQRGLAWKRHCEGRPKVMHYQGQALLLIGDTGREKFPPLGASVEEYYPVQVSRAPPNQLILFSDVSRCQVVSLLTQMLEVRLSCKQALMANT